MMHSRNLLFMISSYCSLKLRSLCMCLGKNHIFRKYSHLYEIKDQWYIMALCIVMMTTHEHAQSAFNKPSYVSMINGLNLIEVKGRDGNLYIREPSNIYNIARYLAFYVLIRYFFHKIGFGLHMGRLLASLRI